MYFELRTAPSLLPRWMFAVQESQRTMTRSVSVKRYLARRSIRMCRKRLPEKCLRCFDTAIFPEQKINGSALLVYRAIQVAPYPFDRDVRFINAPRAAGGSREAVPPLLELRHIPHDLTHDRRVRHHNATLCHHLDQIPIR